MIARFDTGDRVFNHKRGAGTVTDQWGMWLACQQCYRPFGEDRLPRCHCPSKDGPRFFVINGSGIFEVAFDNPSVGTVPISQAWLLPAGVEAGASEVALA